MSLEENVSLCEEIEDGVGTKFVDSIKKALANSLNTFCIPKTLLHRAPMDCVMLDVNTGDDCLIVHHVEDYPLPDNNPVSRYNMPLHPYAFEYVISKAEYNTQGIEYVKRVVNALFYRDVIYPINAHFLGLARDNALDCSADMITLYPTPAERVAICGAALDVDHPVGGFIVPSVAYIPEDVWSTPGPVTWCKVGHGVWYVIMRGYPNTQHTLFALAKGGIGYIAHSDLVADVKIEFGRLIISGGMDMGISLLPNTIAKADLP